MYEKLNHTLKNAGYSLTKPRQAVFSALQSGTPRSMRELTLDLSSVVDRASIYRTISLFEKLGIVIRVNQGWKYKIELSDIFAPHHHHLNCSKCGITISFEEPENFDDMINGIAKQKKFTAQSHKLEIYGLCINCKN